MPPSEQHRRLLDGTIRALRNKAIFSQKVLAKRADLSAIFISRIERGKESPSVDSQVNTAKALKVRGRDLVADI